MFFRKVFLLILLLPFSLAAYQYTYLLMEGPQSIHLLELDDGEELRAVKADGRESVSALADQHEAYAGVNGGFFKVDGEPAGALKIDGVWLGDARFPRGAIGWNKGETVIKPCLDQKEWEDYPNVVQGVPVLIQNSNPIFYYDSEQIGNPGFVTDRHARTAVGLLPNGHLLFVVVDGKQPGFSEGMTLKEITHLMFTLGCQEALNLDGGSSTTMVIEGEVVNQPARCWQGWCLYEEAEVGDAILVVEKHSPQG